MIGIEIAVEEMRGMREQGEQGKQEKIREKSFSPIPNPQSPFTVGQWGYK
jgi:hypothetical protein